MLTSQPGIIIAASVLVAAGLAIYENEQVRIWLDERRRIIASALYSMGDGISPAPSDADQADAAEANRRRRHEIIRRNRMDLIRQAQQEGIAVDLDELAALGSDLKQDGSQSGSANKSRGFDSMVGEDGKLREADKGSEMTQVSSATASGLHTTSDEGLRLRGGAGSRGLDRGAAFANPFDDEAQLLFDQDLLAPGEDENHREITIQSETETLRSVTPRPVTPQQLIDIPIYSAISSEDSEQSRYKSDEELEAEVEEAIRLSLQDMPVLEWEQPMEMAKETSVSSPETLDDSLYALPSPKPASSMDNSLYASPSPRAPVSANNPYIVMSSPVGFSRLLNSTSPDVTQSMAESFHSAVGEAAVEVTQEDGEHTPSGVLTPNSPNEHTRSTAFWFQPGEGFQSEASAVAGSDAEDVGVLSELSSVADPMDTRSEADTNDSFSVVGASTPGSWTDVDSESDSEAVNGQGHATAAR
jgi:hypothetical protein